MTRARRRQLVQAAVLLGVLAAGVLAGAVAASLPQRNDAPAVAAPGTRPVLTPATPPAEPPPPLRMVVGDRYTDSEGQLWQPEYGSLGGRLSSTEAPIANTRDSRLYQQVRWGMRGYDIPVAGAGRYEVTLDMAETYFDAPGQRIFDIQAEQTTKVSDLDVFAAAGGKNTALRVTFDIPVTDGVLNLRFPQKANYPLVGAITVQQVEGYVTTWRSEPDAGATTSPAIG